MLKTIKNLSGLAIQAIKLRKSDSLFLEQKSAKLILQLLGQEKGMALKIAQMMGSNEKALEEIRQLTKGEALEAIPLKEISAVIQDRYDGRVNEIFERVHEATWVASLGQVHKCQLKNDDGMYVLKVLYPGIKEKLSEQLKLLGLFGFLGSQTKLKKWGFDISDYMENFKSALDIETDYLNELKNLELFDHYNKKRNVLYPKAITEHSGSEVLVTSFVPGLSVDEYAKSAEPKAKKEFSEKFLMIYLRQLLVDGFVQGDTHQGNFYVHQNNPVFVDFGHFLTLKDIEREALSCLLAGVIFQNHEKSVEYLEMLGFEKKKIILIKNKLGMFLSCMFRPFVENKNFDLHSWEPKKDIDALLGEDKWWVRSSGDARFFQLIRSFWGIFLLLKSIGSRFNWQMCALEVLGEIDPKLLSLKSSQYISGDDSVGESIAESLKVQVFKNHELSVDLTFPARAVFSIEDLIDSETISKLNSRHINIEEIKAKAIKENLAPQLLFELEDNNKLFKVFLK